MYIGLIKTLSCNYFAQLEAYLYILDPDIKGDIFSKVKSINLILLKTCKAFW